MTDIDIAARHRRLKTFVAVLAAIIAMPVIIAMMVMNAGAERR